MSKTQAAAGKRLVVRMAEAIAAGDAVTANIPGEAKPVPVSKAEEAHGIAILETPTGVMHFVALGALSAIAVQGPNKPATISRGAIAAGARRGAKPA